MNTGTHPVTSEEVMALLDGELSAAEAEAVSNHIGHCPACRTIASQLGSTSRSLSAWRVPTATANLENVVRELAAKASSGHKLGKGSFWVRSSFWTWKQWAMVSAGPIAALLLVSAVLLPNLMRAHKTVTPLMVQEADQRTPQESQDTITVGHSKIAKRQTAKSAPVPTLTSPGIAADSNGLFHGLGDHPQNSFSVDGQPITDRQAKVFSNDGTGTMIARVVSLSVVVKNFAASRSSLDAILARHHGYAAQLSVSTPEGVARSLQASLRIPAPETSAAVADIKALGRIENETQSGEEVTHQHADLVARLRNARDTEQRFRSILEQHTGNVVEVLQVEEGIARVRGEIERMEAEQKTLEHRVDFAAIELQLTEEYKAQLNPPSPSVSTLIHNAFVEGYRNAVGTVFSIVLFMVEYVPALFIWLAVLGSPVTLLWRRYRRRLAAG
jgi:hypothetical protein